MKFKKVISWVLVFFVSIVLVADIMLIFLPKMAGYGCYAVATRSMEPTIKRGSLLLTKEIELEKIQENDVLTFSDKNNKIYFTHRVTRVDKINQIIYTKGDANQLEDPSPTKYEYAKGKVEKVFPFLGYVKIAFTSPYAIVGTLAVVVILLIADILVGKKRANRKKAE